MLFHLFGFPPCNDNRGANLESLQCPDSRASFLRQSVNARNSVIHPMSRAHVYYRTKRREKDAVPSPPNTNFAQTLSSRSRLLHLGY